MLQISQIELLHTTAKYRPDGSPKELSDEHQRAVSELLRAQSRNRVATVRKNGVKMAARLAEFTAGMISRRLAR